MKIAWKYENIKYANLLEDISKSSQYIFDLSRKLQDSHFIDKNKDILVKRNIENKSTIDQLRDILKNLIKDYQAYTDDLKENENRIARFVINNLFFDDYYAYDKKNIPIEYLNEIKTQLIALKNVSRSINGVVYISLNNQFLNPDIFKLLFYFSDYVFTIKSFILDPQKLEDYDGLFYINKLPKVCSMKSTDLETDTYGLIVEKRKIIIEKIDIGLEIVRNTKVKEKDLPTS